MPELRRSVRLQVPDELQTAVLDTGREALPCRLLDQSSGGFAISMPSPAPLFVGMIAVLTTAISSGRVKVVHLKPDGDDVRAGLERVAEIAPAARASRTTAGRRGGSTGWMTAASGSGLVLALLGLWIVWSVMGRPGMIASGDPVAPLANRSTTRGSQSAPPSADALLSSSVARRLELSAEQQQEIAEIVRERNASIQRLYQGTTARQSRAVAMQLSAARREADEEAWQVLSSRQQRLYRAG